MPINDTHYRIVIVHQVTVGQMTQPHTHLSALARTALRHKSIPLAGMPDKRCMYEQCAMPTAAEGVGKHQCVVESEAAHIVGAVESAPTMSEPIISDEQTAWTALYISDYELVASACNPLHRRMPIACIEVAYKFTPCLFHRAYTIINTDSEQWLTIAIRQHKGCE